MLTVNVMGNPGHPVEVGVTTIVPLMLDPVVFAGAFQLGIFPVPLVASPITELEFAQLIVAPGGVLTKLPIVTG